MRGIVVVLVVFGVLGVVAPPAIAQAPAAKVTINGLIDTITFASKNLSQEEFDFSRTGDRQWVTRNRGVFTLWGEVGKVKGALALEFDIGWGQTDTTETITAKHGPAAISFLNGEFGSNNDVNGIPEVKWLFVEFPLPWIPAPTTVRLGGQSDRWTFKPSVLVYTDSPGVTLESTWSPALKSRLAYFQYDEASVGFGKGPSGAATTFPRGDAWAVEASLEVSPIKGLDIMPLYVYWEQGPNGTQSGSGQFTWEPARGGLPLFNTPNMIGPLPGGLPSCGVPVSGCKEHRHYLGVDARWKAGIFFFNPTAIYQWGRRDIINAVTSTRNNGQGEHGFLVDLEGGVTLGPLTVPVMAIYSSGNKASDNIGNRAGTPDRLNYYQPLYIDVAYGAGRISEVLSLNSIDYLKSFALGSSLHEGAAIGYDRYGRFDLGVRPKYALTPAVTITGLAAAHWTAEEVDTNAGFSAVTGLVPSPDAQQRGRRYLGTDTAVMLTYALAPGLTFDMGAGIFWVGEALERCNVNESSTTFPIPALAVGTTGCTTGRKDPKDAYWGAARVRYQF